MAVTKKEKRFNFQFLLAFGDESVACRVWANNEGQAKNYHKTLILGRFYLLPSSQYQVAGKVYGNDLNNTHHLSLNLQYYERLVPLEVIFKPVIQDNSRTITVDLAVDKPFAPNFNPNRGNSARPKQRKVEQKHFEKKTMLEENQSVLHVIRTPLTPVLPVHTCAEMETASCFIKKPTQTTNPVIANPTPPPPPRISDTLPDKER